MTEIATKAPIETTTSASRSAWWPFLGSIGLLAGAYAAEWVKARYFESIVNDPSPPLAGPDLGPWTLMAWVIRLVAMALFVGLAWLVFRGPRGRVVGLAMLAIGLYFPVAVLVYQATYDFAPVALPLLNVADGTGDTVVWISVGIVVLGAIALIWPTADPALEA
jgi:hypothetical protein